MNAVVPQSVVPDRVNAEIIRRRLAGETNVSIAVALGYSEQGLKWRIAKLKAQGWLPATVHRPILGAEHHAHGPGCWDGPTIGRLRTLWDEGHATEEIGRRLGMSKNAVVGKAHRLDLPARPSPIGHGHGRPRETNAAYLARIAEQPKPPRSGKQGVNRYPLPPDAATIPPLASLAAAPTPAPTSPPRPPPAAAAPHRVPVQHVRETAPPARYGRVEPCSWPLDHPTNPRRFLSCNAPSVPGRPYCPVHCEAAYIRVRDRREDAHA